MRHFKYIIFTISCFPIESFGQRIKNDSAQINLKYSKANYEIINLDTIVKHYVIGEYGTPNFKEWDSTKIWADIILTDLPSKIDLASFKTKVEEIMKTKGINKAYVFRDSYSSMLFRMSSQYAAKKLKERNGYLGQYNVD